MEEATIADADSRLGDEAVDLLRRLIRIDTSNPPGRERPVQELLSATLSEAGFDCELLAATDAERPNLVARLRGDADGPTLCLLGHADTVPARPEEWSHDPWSAALADGEVWGRGAQDMKDQVAAEVAAAAALAREGWRPRGELLLVITADEEAGAQVGAAWLCREHPDKVRADFVVNEGGGVALDYDGRRLYPVSVGEKGVFRFRLIAHGRAGHASVPALGDNALLRLGPLLERLSDQPPLAPTREGLAFLSALLGEDVDGEPAGLERALARVRDASPPVAAFLSEPMLRITVTPTMARASQKVNVIPSRAELGVDCRVPPGMGEAEVVAAVRGLLGANGFELEFLDRITGSASPLDTPLWDAIADWIGINDPGAELAPIVMPGFSDSHWWRQAFGTTVYGFSPQREMSLAEAAMLVHAPDERIKAADVGFAARFFRDLARAVLG